MIKKKIPIFVFIFCIFLSIVTLVFIKDRKGLIHATFSIPQTTTLFIFNFFRIGQSSESKENILLRTELAKMNLLQADNASLRDQFQTSSPLQSQLLPSTIVGMPSFLPGFSMPEEYVIHAGKKDKVEINYPIIYKDNFIGKVVDLQDNFSKVLLVSNKNTSFTAKTAQTEATGIVRGMGNGRIIFDNVLLSDSLKVGDMVVTGGDVSLNGKGFPPGLIIGKITSVERNPSNLFQKASVLPLVDFSRLINVFVLISNQ